MGHRSGKHTWLRPLLSLLYVVCLAACGSALKLRVSDRSASFSLRSYSLDRVLESRRIAHHGANERRAATSGDRCGQLGQLPVGAARASDRVLCAETLGCRSCLWASLSYSSHPVCRGRCLHVLRTYRGLFQPFRPTSMRLMVSTRRHHQARPGLATATRLALKDSLSCCFSR